MKAQQRSLAIPHRALRASTVNGFHTAAGILALIVVVVLAVGFHTAIWNWQGTIWRDLSSRFGVNVTTLGGSEYRWEQVFLVSSLQDVVLTTLALTLSAWLVLRSSVVPTVKGLFLALTVPLFLYTLVTFLRGTPPVDALSHSGTEWLYGEVVLWCLVPLIYAVYLFPLPFSLPVKLLSLVAVLAMSVVWRTATPVIYMLIAVYSQGLFAIPAWMALGPWADFLYVIPFFAGTLSLYRGGRQRDYRT